MINYIGYGFDTNEVSDRQWTKLVRVYHNKTYQSIRKKAKERYTNPREIRQYIIEETNRYAKQDDKCRFLCDIINGDDKPRMYDTVENYDNYLVFNRIDFIDYQPRATQIKNPSDFVNFIQQYISTRNIKFSYIYEGTESIGPIYHVNP